MDYGAARLPSILRACRRPRSTSWSSSARSPSGARALLIERRAPPEARAELEAWENRRLSREEFEQRVNAPWTEREREDFAALCAWFNRRYPTPGERLRAIRHLAAQWARNRPR